MNRIIKWFHGRIYYHTKNYKFQYNSWNRNWFYTVWWKTFVCYIIIIYISWYENENLSKIIYMNKIMLSSVNWLQYSYIINMYIYRPTFHALGDAQLLWSIPFCLFVTCHEKPVWPISINTALCCINFL